MSARIIEVRAEEAPKGGHPHIEKVKLQNGKVERRSLVANLIEAGLVYLASQPGGAEARVIIASCPDCGEPDYITTAYDSSESNALLSLPSF